MTVKYCQEGDNDVDRGDDRRQRWWEMSLLGSCRRGEEGLGRRRSGREIKEKEEGSTHNLDSREMHRSEGIYKSIGRVLLPPPLWR